MPTDWEACYQSGETPWDKGAAAPPLLEWLEDPSHRFDGDVLVPGCGAGHDVRAIAQSHQACAVHGMDISASAVANAYKLTRTGNETYVQADLFALPPEYRGRFDWVFEHTCFCAIDPNRRAEYVQAVANALRLGGHLLAIFYLRPWAGGESPPPGGGPPFGSTVAELDELFEERFVLLEERIPTVAYPGREGRELLRLLRRR